jgi:hypothetical protein
MIADGSVNIVLHINISVPRTIILASFKQFPSEFFINGIAWRDSALKK